MTEDSANQTVFGHDVFVSYASQDAAIANAVVENLERHGCKCWIAPRDVKPGAQYADAIVRAINEAKSVVLVLSGSAFDSAHVAREVERAASKRKSIIPFRIDDASLNPEFEYFLSNAQWIEVPRLGMAAALAKLAEATSHASTTGPRAAPAAAAISDKSIVVLPFADMSEKKDQEYFADGMAEEIIGLLVKFPGLKVISRTSSFQYKGKTEDLCKIGTQLGVTYVLQGGVRKSGDRLRVTTQLINSKDETHLWSQTYDRNLSDVLKMQDEIAIAVVRALQIEVVGIVMSRPSVRNTEAYTLYLQGFHSFGRFDQGGIEQGLSDFQRSLELDPSSAEAAHMLGAAYALLGSWGFMAPTVAFEKAREAQEHALKLDPTLAIAHAVLGLVHCAEWNWTAANRDFQQALSLGPREAVVLFLAADNSRIMGRWDEALKLVNRSLVVDPLSPHGNFVLAAIQVHRGRLQEAEAAARRALASSPAFAFAHFTLGGVLLARGEAEAALAEMLKEEDGARRLSGSAMAYFALGRRADSDAALVQLEKGHAGQNPFEIAKTYAFRCESDEAFKWLDRAYAQKDTRLTFIKGDPAMKKLEGDARYKAFLRRMNLPE